MLNDCSNCSMIFFLGSNCSKNPLFFHVTNTSFIWVPWVNHGLGTNEDTVPRYGDIVKGLGCQQTSVYEYRQ